MSFSGSLRFLLRVFFGFNTGWQLLADGTGASLTITRKAYEMQSTVINKSSNDCISVNLERCHHWNLLCIKPNHVGCNGGVIPWCDKPKQVDQFIEVCFFSSLSMRSSGLVCMILKSSWYSGSWKALAEWHSLIAWKQVKIKVDVRSGIAFTMPIWCGSRPKIKRLPKGKGELRHFQNMMSKTAYCLFESVPILSMNRVSRARMMWHRRGFLRILLRAKRSVL